MVSARPGSPTQARIVAPTGPGQRQVSETGFLLERLSDKGFLQLVKISHRRLFLDCVAKVVDRMIFRAVG